jgi:hypothetical protein
MELDKDKVRTLDADDKAEMDRANDRVDAEMKLLESEAKEQVAQGLQDERIADEAKRLRREAEEDLRKVDAEN